MKLVFSPAIVLNSPVIYQYNRVYNFTTMVDRVEQLKNLVPDLAPWQQSIGFFDEFAFDTSYAQFIKTNDFAFLDLMKIMVPIYKGEDVLVLTDTSIPIYEILTESLVKFIDTFYGFIPSVVKELEDFECVRDSSFTAQGILNLDSDRIRYVALVARYNIREGLL
jgi:hypothetical protein